MNLADALRCGKPGCECKSGSRTHCPNTAGHHNGDSNPSLSVTETGGKTLIHCHGGCSQGSVIAALTERGLWNPEPVMPTPIRPGRGQQVAVYDYRNAAGDLIAQKGRFEQAGSKTFAWAIPEHDWSEGLGAIAIADLPLYRLEDVLAHPQDPVYFVEGEKAADACAERGLVAVCCGGGAAQRSFGNGLDPLLSRDVILWPDNDEAGATLMGRLHALLPQARFLRPVLPPKGDAYDYFAAGGSVNALADLLLVNEATVSVPASDAVTVLLPIPTGTVTFAFTELTAGKRAIDSTLLIQVNAPGKRRTQFASRLNLESSSGREGLRRELEGVHGKTDMNWTALISDACSLAAEAWRGIDTSAELRDVALPEVRQWAVDNFAPENVVTIIFGMGGSGKSYLVADIALCCLYGMPWMGLRTTPVGGVLVIDYEDREDEWRRRVQQIADGHGWPFPESGYRYLPGNAIPVADQIPRLRKLIADWDIGLIVVDSAASAVGDDLVVPTSASRMINALLTLNVTPLVLAHNTKAEDSSYPYGSIFFHNLARTTHYVEAIQEEGSNIVEVVIWNRKANRGKQKPISLRMTFPINDDNGPVNIDMTTQIPLPLQSDTRNNREQIMRLLIASSHSLSAREISDATGIVVENVRNTLSRNTDWFVNTERGMWDLKRRDEAAQ